jgi:hypothetical protein
MSILASPGTVPYAIVDSRVFQRQGKPGKAGKVVGLLRDACDATKDPKTAELPTRWLGDRV